MIEGLIEVANFNTEHISESSEKVAPLPVRFEEEYVADFAFLA
jgi:hypothetical protein